MNSGDHATEKILRKTITGKGKSSGEKVSNKSLPIEILALILPSPVRMTVLIWTIFIE